MRASRPAGRGYPAAPALRAAVKGKAALRPGGPLPGHARAAARMPRGIHAADLPGTLYQLKNIAATHCVIMSLCYNIPIRNR